MVGPLIVGCIVVWLVGCFVFVLWFVAFCGLMCWLLFRVGVLLNVFLSVIYISFGGNGQFMGRLLIIVC